MQRDSCHFPQNDVWCAVIGKKNIQIIFTNHFDGWLLCVFDLFKVFWDEIVFCYGAFGTVTQNMFDKWLIFHVSLF
jgi:hypothetical protein